MVKNWFGLAATQRSSSSLVLSESVPQVRQSLRVSGFKGRADFIPAVTFRRIHG
jgi:hypothetical protein